MAEVEPVVFVSYARADAAWVDRLRIHLRPLVRKGVLSVWDDSQIAPGQLWEDQIAGALARAHIAILLVSADFLASEFIANNELPPLLHRAREAGLLVVPLIVGPCLFSEHSELSRYQTANDPRKPLSALAPAEAEAALLALARSVDQVLRRPLVAMPANPQARPLHESYGGASERFAARDPFAVDRPINLGFDGPIQEGMPIGWFNSFGHVSDVSTDYDIRTVARSAARSDGICAVLQKKRARSSEFGSMMQRCRGHFLAGQSIRFEGELRTEHVTAWAGLWLRADAESEVDLFFDNMSNRPVVGTTGWKRYSIDAALPADTAWLNYGVVLVGSGAVYVDNLRLLRWTERSRWEDV